METETIPMPYQPSSSSLSMLSCEDLGEKKKKVKPLGGRKKNK